MLDLILFAIYWIISSLIRGKEEKEIHIEHPWIYQIVANKRNSIDVDKFDYLNNLIDQLNTDLNKKDDDSFNKEYLNDLYSFNLKTKTFEEIETNEDDYDDEEEFQKLPILSSNIIVLKKMLQSNIYLIFIIPYFPSFRTYMTETHSSSIFLKA